MDVDRDRSYETKKVFLQRERHWPPNLALSQPKQREERMGGLSLRDGFSVARSQAIGNMPKRYSQAQINHAVITQIKDMFGAGLAFTGSSMSGNLNAIAIGVYQESDQ